MKWVPHKSNKPQGLDSKEIFVQGKLSELNFELKPKSKYWRAGFKLFDPNNTLLPLRSVNSFLFHLGSTNIVDEFGLTAYLEGRHIKELNKTCKYPSNGDIKVKVVINHNNFIEIYINDSLEFKPNWHFKNPNIREKLFLVAWGDDNNFEVIFDKITATNWKKSKTKVVNPILQVTGKNNIFLNSSVLGPAYIGGEGNSFVKTSINSIGKLKKKIPWYRDPKWLITLVMTLLTTSTPWWMPYLNNSDYRSRKTKGELAVSTPTILLPTIVKKATEVIDDVDTVVYIDESKSYSDTISGLVVGVNYVLPNLYSDLTITKPNKPSEEFDRVKSGKTFQYTGKDKKMYTMSIVEIGSESVGIRITAK